MVDYLGLAPMLKDALQNYTESGGQGSPQLDKHTVVQASMQIRSSIISGVGISIDANG